MVSALLVLSDKSAILPFRGPSASSNGVVVGHLASPTNLRRQHCISVFYRFAYRAAALHGCIRTFGNSDPP